MVKFAFNAHGYRFTNGLSILKNSFDLAMTAVGGSAAEARDAAVEYAARLDGGGSPEEERDEDGHILWDQGTILAMKLEDADETAMELRKAFVLAMYHHWERSARRWTGKPHGNHKALAAAIGALGQPLDQRLDAVRVLVNLLKHDNPTTGAELRAAWPSTFAAHVQAGIDPSSWYEAVELTDSQVDEVYGIVIASGPTSKTTWSAPIALP